MKGRILASFGWVLGLAAVSVAAFMGTTDVADSRTEPGATVQAWSAIALEGPEVAGQIMLSSGPDPVEKMVETVDDSGDDGETRETVDRYLLARIAMAEAEGEDTEGKALVMLVVLNRVRADGFPDTVEGVIYQPGQFSPVSSGKFDKVEPDDDCWQALSMIEEDGWDESRGATFFESKSASTWHEENLQFLFRHGSHYFYTEKGDG